MIATGMRDYTPILLLIAELADGVECPSELEGTDSLVILALDEN